MSQFKHSSWDTSKCERFGKQYTLRLWAIEGGTLRKDGKGNKEEKERDGDKENKRTTRHKKQTRGGEGEVKKGIG